MSTSETIQGFDPKHDAAQTVNGGKVKQMYEQLVARGEDDAAEALRHADTLSEQIELAQSHREFDPKHDDWQSTAKGEIQRVYDWLHDQGHNGEAESLRHMDTTRAQQNRVSELKQQYPIPRPGE